MNWFTGLVVYVLIWWTVLFAVLPIGTRPIVDADEQTGWRGAPERPRLLMKVIVTTLVAGVVWFGGLAADHQRLCEFPPRLVRCAERLSSASTQPGPMSETASPHLRYVRWSALQAISTVREEAPSSSDLPCDGVSSPNLARHHRRPGRLPVNRSVRRSHALLFDNRLVTAILLRARHCAAHNSFADGLLLAGWPAGG